MVETRTADICDPPAWAMEGRGRDAHYWAPTGSPEAGHRLRRPGGLVWRNASTPSFRVLSDEEAAMWDAAKNGVRFGVLCEMLAGSDADDAAARAARYLQDWISSGLLSSATAELSE